MNLDTFKTLKNNHGFYPGPKGSKKIKWTINKKSPLGDLGVKE